MTQDLEPQSEKDNLEIEWAASGTPPTPSFEELIVVSDNREDNEWRKTVLLWLTPKGLAPLISYVHRERRKLQLSFVAESFAALLVLLFWVTLWVKKFKLARPIHAIGAVCVVFVLVWVARYLSNLRPVWSAPQEETATLLGYVKRRLQARIEWLGFYQQAMVGLTIVLALWTPWMFWSFRDAYLSQPWRAMVGFGGWIAILGVVFAKVNHKKRKTEKSLKLLCKLVPSPKQS